MPELLVRRALFAAGFRYRLHRKDLPGAPDVALLGPKIAIFVHGCFWHMHAGCRFARMPASRREFWQEKLQGNAARDRKAVAALLALGWRVLVVWECAIRDREIRADLGDRLSAWIRGGEVSGELASPGARA